MPPKEKAVLQMTLCAALWSIAGIFIKLIQCNPFVIAGFRSLLAALTVAVFMKIRGERFVINKNVVLSGIVMCLTFFSFVSANKLTTSANAIVLQYTAPVFILIASAVFLKQKLIVPDILVVVMTIAGISLFFLDQLDAGHMLGNIIAVFSGLTFAAMLLLVKRTDASARMSGILLAHLMTAVIGVPFIFFTDNTFTVSSIGYLIILGVFQMGISYILYGLAAEHCPPLACSLLSAVEPLLNPVWVALFAGEIPGMLSLIGGVIVLLSITAWCIYQDKKSRLAPVQRD